MIWNRKCNHIRKLLALSAGNDLDEQGQAEARRHAATCPQCREYAVRIESSQQLLEQSALAACEGPAVASVWPNVQRSLRSVQPVSAPATWERWLPMTAAAAACFAAMVIMELPPFAPPAHNMAERNNLTIPFVVSQPLDEEESLAAEPVHGIVPFDQW